MLRVMVAESGTLEAVGARGADGPQVTTGAFSKAAVKPFREEAWT